MARRYGIEHRDGTWHVYMRDGPTSAPVFLGRCKSRKVAMRTLKALSAMKGSA